jgi:putative endonuclease
VRVLAHEHSHKQTPNPPTVIPAKAGIHFALALRIRSNSKWIPASAGTTEWWMREKEPCVYILASRERGTLYVGVASNLVKRVWEHKSHAVAGFTHAYDVTRLVWFERHESMREAISREKQIKDWHRSWKLELVEKSNPRWRDLYNDIL